MGERGFKLDATQASKQQRGRERVRLAILRKTPKRLPGRPLFALRLKLDHQMGPIFAPPQPVRFRCFRFRPGRFAALPCLCWPPTYSSSPHTHTHTHAHTDGRPIIRRGAHCCVTTAHRRSVQTEASCSLATCCAQPVHFQLLLNGPLLAPFFSIFPFFFHGQKSRISIFVRPMDKDPAIEQHRSGYQLS